MFINHASKQVAAKIVYYGPGLSGKTTNLQYIFSTTNPSTRGELVSMETEVERTLFFDLLPVNVGLIKGYQVRFQLYTVPGQIFYDSTRKLVLKGADGIVFVADSQELMEQSNIDSLNNLRQNLEEQGQDFYKVPLVFQYNKRDLKNILPFEQINSTLNPDDFPAFEAVSSKGEGVIETLKEVSARTLIEIKKIIDRAQAPASASKQAINFDTDSNRKLIDRSDLQVKTISATVEDDFHSIELPEEEESPEISQTSLEDMVSENRAAVNLEEDIQEIELTDDIEIKDIEEDDDIKVEVDFEISDDSLSGIENLLPDEDEDDKVEEEEKVELPETEEISATIELDDEPELFEDEKEEELTIDTSPSEPEIQIEELVKEDIKPEPKTDTKVKSSKDLEQLNILDGLSDKKRVTMLRKLVNPGKALKVTVSSGDEELDVFDVSIDKTTKKITLIFDVKK